VRAVDYPCFCFVVSRLSLDRPLNSFSGSSFARRPALPCLPSSWHAAHSGFSGFLSPFSNLCVPCSSWSNVCNRFSFLSCGSILSSNGRTIRATPPPRCRPWLPSMGLIEDSFPFPLLLSSLSCLVPSLPSSNTLKIPSL